MDSFFPNRLRGNSSLALTCPQGEEESIPLLWVVNGRSEDVLPALTYCFPNFCGHPFPVRGITGATMWPRMVASPRSQAPLQEKMMTNRNNPALQRAAPSQRTTQPQRTAQPTRTTSPKHPAQPQRPTQPQHIARPQRTAPKTPITADAAQRVQRSTAATNNGKQADWTRNLQSAADRRAAETKATGKPVGGAGGATGQDGRKASGAKKPA